MGDIKCVCQDESGHFLKTKSYVQLEETFKRKNVKNCEQKSIANFQEALVTFYKVLNFNFYNF